MSASILRLVTANTTNLTPVKKNAAAVVKGIAAVNTAAYAIFVKLYWFLPTAAEAPTVGTTPPNMTIEIPALGTTTGGVQQSWPDGFTAPGDLWMAVTKLAADSDTTVVVAGDGLISLLYE